MTELERANDTIRELRAEVEELSIDFVTGIVGRRVLEREMEKQFARSRRLGRHVGMLMIDIDHFKEVNDKFGHECGDDVLNAVAQVIAGQARGGDTVGRYGGEEIVVCVDDAGTVRAFAERVRKVIDNFRCRTLPHVTVSIGFATSEPEDTSASDTLKRADTALYVAKAAGRNRVSG